MSVGYSREHDELRQVVREFLGERSPSSEVRRLMEAEEGRDDEVWAMLTGQLGLSGIAVPARYGGAGYGPVELGIVLEEMGRALLVAPYFSTVVLAGQALTASGDVGHQVVANVLRLCRARAASAQAVGGEVVGGPR